MQAAPTISTFIGIRESGVIFEDLRAFVAVAQLGSFSKAAASLCVAQSALSKRVQRLEHRVGAALFERRARDVVLTETGQGFLPRAQQVVDEVIDIERNLSNHVQTPSGVVHIAMPQRSCSLLAPPLLRRCRQELPLVALHIHEGTPANVHTWLLEGVADIALVFNPELGPDFLVKPFLMEPLCLLAPPPPLRRQLAEPVPAVCTLADLARLPLILPRRPNSVRVLVDRLCAGNGVRPNIIYEADGTHTVRGMVEQGMGFTVFSLSAWSGAIKAGEIEAIPFSSPLMNWKLCIVRPRAAIGSVAANRVSEILEQEADKLLNTGAWPSAKRISEPLGSDKSP